MGVGLDWPLGRFAAACPDGVKVSLSFSFLVLGFLEAPGMK